MENRPEHPNSRKVSDDFAKRDQPFAFKPGLGTNTFPTSHFHRKLGLSPTIAISFSKCFHHNCAMIITFSCLFELDTPLGRKCQLEHRTSNLPLVGLGRLTLLQYFAERLRVWLGHGVDRARSVVILDSHARTARRCLPRVNELIDVLVGQSARHDRIVVHVAVVITAETRDLQ